MMKILTPMLSVLFGVFVAAIVSLIIDPETIPVGIVAGAGCAIPVLSYLFCGRKALGIGVVVFEVISINSLLGIAYLLVLKSESGDQLIVYASMIINASVISAIAFLVFVNHISSIRSKSENR